jgi:hypothetical protein
MSEARVLLTGAQYQALTSLLATVKRDVTVDVALRHSDEAAQHVDVTVYFDLGRKTNIWRIEDDGFIRDMGTL